MGKKSFESTHSTKKRESDDWKTPPKKRDPSPSPIHVEQPQIDWEPTLRIYDPSPPPKPSRRCGMYIGAFPLAVFGALFLILLFVNVSYTTIGLYNSYPRQDPSSQRGFLPFPYPISWNQLGQNGPLNAGFPMADVSHPPVETVITTSTSVVTSTAVVTSTSVVVTVTPAPISNAGPLGQVEPLPEAGATTTAQPSPSTVESSSSTSQSSSSESQGLVVTSTFWAPVPTVTSLKLITLPTAATSTPEPQPSGVRNPSQGD